MKMSAFLFFTILPKGNMYDAMYASQEWGLKGTLA